MLRVAEGGGRGEGRGIGRQTVTAMGVLICAYY